ncbi:MAG TPA: hypothetical protein DHW47_02575 [Oscillibacter sp.]|nr:hypothetical protein [Oscillibacter sp.]
MSYEYDENNGLQPRPPKKNNNNDLSSWIIIGAMFLFGLWPVGLILLLSKLSEGGGRKMRQQAREAWQRTAAGSAEVKSAQAKPAAAKKAVRKVTETPNYSDKGAKVMKIIGAAVAILGAFFLVQQVDYFELRYAIKWHEWMDLLRQVFYPMGMMAGGVSLLLGSGAMKRRQRRFATYLRTAGQKAAVPLDYLARAADVSRKRVEKDVNLMLEKGMWGDEAYIDLGSGMLFKSQEAATAYFDAAHRAKAEQEQPTQAAAAPEGYAAILAQIRDLNDRIADERLSAQMDRMEQVAGRIFRLIEEDENKRAAAGTFLSYYLPTTLKLLENYAAFEEAGVSGENLSQAKAKIEKTMDSIVAGFEHQLDELYRTDAMDIDSDIRVMETMLRRDTASVADDFGLNGGSAVQQKES